MEDGVCSGVQLFNHTCFVHDYVRHITIYPNCAWRCVCKTVSVPPNGETPQILQVFERGMKMKKLIVALLVAALCMVAPAIAFEWGEDLGPDPESVFIVFPYQHTYNTYFDVIIGDEEQTKTTYAGWCADPNTDSIRDVLYEATLTNISGVSEEWNKVNWILNNKGNAKYQDIQKAIWDILEAKVSEHTIIAGEWDNATVKQLFADADPEFVPECGMIWGILVEPNGDWIGQPAIIEIPMPACPSPVPEFPSMMIPVFLVGSLTLAASVLKKE